MFNIFNIFRRRPDQLVIDKGNVYCPIRKRNTDIDICAGCPRVTEFNPDANPPYLRCRVDSGPRSPGKCFT